MFTIPNDADCAYTVTIGSVTFAPQAAPDKGDVDMLVAGQQGTGVVTGCAVSPQGSPDGTVAVAAGVAAVGFLPVLVAAVTVNVLSGGGSTPAHATLHRFDLIVVSAVGVVSVVAGNAAAAPKFPAIPANSAVLASVYVPATDTTVGADQLVDKRVPVNVGPRDRSWIRGSAAHVLDDEFNDGVLDPAWTVVSPSGTLTVAEGADCLSAKYAGQGNGLHCGIVKPMGSFAIGNYVQASFRTLARQNYGMAGIILTNGTAAGSLNVWGMTYHYISGIPLFQVVNYTGAFNVAKASPSSAAAAPPNGPIHIRVTWVGTNTWRTEWSIDGVSWSTFGFADFVFAMTPTHIGLGFSTWTGTVDSLTSVDYFRVG